MESFTTGVDNWIDLKYTVIGDVVTQENQSIKQEKKVRNCIAGEWLTTGIT